MLMSKQTQENIKWVARALGKDESRPHTCVIHIETVEHQRFIVATNDLILNIIQLPENLNDDLPEDGDYNIAKAGKDVVLINSKDSFVPNWNWRCVIPEPDPNNYIGFRIDRKSNCISRAMYDIYDKWRIKLDHTLIESALGVGDWVARAKTARKAVVFAQGVKTALIATLVDD